MTIVFDLMFMFIYTHGNKRRHAIIAALSVAVVVGNRARNRSWCRWCVVRGRLGTRIDFHGIVSRVYACERVSKPFALRRDDNLVRPMGPPILLRVSQGNSPQRPGDFPRPANIISATSILCRMSNAVLSQIHKIIR